MRINLQPAFILHHRAYRETSLLIDAFTPEHGRIGLVARGVRTKNSKSRALLQPFTPLLLSWQGKSELMTLVSAESNGLPLSLRGDCLLAGFYLNEVLTRVLQKYDPHPDLFFMYEQTIHALQTNELQQKTLRLFEKNLLIQLGYGLQLDYSLPDKLPLAAEKYYYFQPEQGFLLVENKEQEGVFSGKNLIALAQEDFTEIEMLRDAKRLMRMALMPLLGSRPLESRKLFK